MDWDVIGATGEILGALGVIVTLGFLVVQISHNTKSSQAATLHSLMSDVSRNMDLLLNPQTSSIWSRGLAAPDSLDSTEYNIFASIFSKNIVHFVDLYYQHRNGLVPQSFMEGYERDMVYLLSFPGAKKAWEEQKPSYGPEFGEFFDELIQSNKYSDLPKFIVS